MERSANLRENAASSLREALSGSESLPNDKLPALLLSMPGGLRTAISVVAWSDSLVMSSAMVLSRLEEDASASVCLYEFFSSHIWMEAAKSFITKMPSRLAECQRTLQRECALAWARLAQRTAKDEAATPGPRLPIPELQQVLLPTIKNDKKTYSLNALSFGLLQHRHCAICVLATMSFRVTYWHSPPCVIPMRRIGTLYRI